MYPAPTIVALFGVLLKAQTKNSTNLRSHHKHREITVCVLNIHKQIPNILVCSDLFNSKIRNTPRKYKKLTIARLRT